MRAFSLLFALISVVLLVQFVAYLIIGPVQTVFVVALLVGFAACAGAALYLLKPYEDREALQRRREQWRARQASRGSGNGDNDRPHGREGSDDHQGDDPG
jgi:hypothetical protein